MCVSQVSRDLDVRAGGGVQKYSRAFEHALFKSHQFSLVSSCRFSLEVLAGLGNAVLPTQQGRQVCPQTPLHRGSSDAGALCSAWVGRCNSSPLVSMPTDLKIAMPFL